MPVALAMMYAFGVPGPAGGMRAADCVPVSSRLRHAGSVGVTGSVLSQASVQEAPRVVGAVGPVIGFPPSVSRKVTTTFRPVAATATVSIVTLGAAGVAAVPGGAGSSSGP